MESLEVQIGKLQQKVEDGFEHIGNAIKEIKDGTAKRIDNLEKDKADKNDLAETQNKINRLQKILDEDIEKRVSCIEADKKTNSLYIKLVLLGVSIIFGMFIWHLSGYHI